MSYSAAYNKHKTMSNEVVTTGVAAPATEPKPKRKRSVINQAHARELTKAEGVGQAAKNSERLTVLSNREIDEAFADGLLDDVDSARTKAGEVVLNTTAHRNATATAKQAQKQLEAGLREVQKAAKQKYARTNRIVLGDYFIGKKLNSSQPNLAQTSQTIVARAASEKLPGFTAAKVKALGTQRQTWLDAQTAQGEAETAAINSRAELKTMLKSIKDRKIAVQLAADAEWPHTEHEHHGIRREFGLAATRPLAA